MDNQPLHLEPQHASNDYITVKKEYIDNLENQNKKLKEDLCNVKEDFERLHYMFDASNTENRKDSNSLDVELAETREQFKTVKAENVHLKERNDTLFKLGKLALNNTKVTQPVLEILDDEDEDGLTALV